MSTNFYLPQTCPNACEHCTVQDLHIGKRSMGWAFGFRGYPDVRTREDWEAQVAQVGVVIDENGLRYSPTEFWQLVDATREPHNGVRPLTRFAARGTMNIPLDDPHGYRDQAGWDFTTVEFC